MYVHCFREVKCQNADCDKKIVPYIRSVKPCLELDLVFEPDKKTRIMCSNCGNSFFDIVYLDRTYPVAHVIPENGAEIAPPQK